MICFAILAHDNEEVLHNQVRNIRQYNPNAWIVLYNGGKNPEFGKASDVVLCPRSRPLQYGKLGRYFFDVMKWLEEDGVEYDYLVSFDSDVMFVNSGYETYLNDKLKDYDCMGVNMGIQCSPDEVRHWYPGQTLWKEWDAWGPFFQIDCFCGTLNPMQVYTHRIVREMIRDVDEQRLEELLEKTKVFALEEMLHATLAVRCGGRPRKYDWETAGYTRCGAPISLEEIQRAKTLSNVFFVHPVKRDMADPARRWITIQHD